MMLSLERSSKRTILIGICFALAGAFFYGLNVPAAQIASKYGLRGVDIIFWRVVAVVPLLLIYAHMSKQSLALPLAERPMTLRLAFAAAGTAIGYLTSIQYIPVSIAVLILYTYPLQVMLLTRLIEKRRLPLQRYMVFAVAFCGLLIALAPGITALDWRGLAFAAFASSCSAIMFVSASRINIPPLVSFFWTQVVMGPLALIFAFTTGELASLSMWKAGALAAFFSIIGYFIGYLFQLAASQKISAATTSLMFLAEPVVAIASAVAFLGETFSPLQIAGALLVLCALAYDIISTFKVNQR